MKKLFLSVMACYALTASAQVQPGQNFLYLYSDSIIYAKKILLRPDFSGYWQLRVDSRRVPADQVKFFSNEDGFFANTRRLTFMRDTEFSERIIEGKINVYQERIYDPFFYERGYGYGNRYGYARTNVNLSMYYNKGFDDLKKVNYRNLKNDLADHPVSLGYLNSYRKKSNLSKIMYGAAGASLIGGLISFVAKGSSKKDLQMGHGFGSMPSIKEQNYTASFVLMGLGFGAAVGGYAIQQSGSRNLEQAIDAYNR